MRDAGCNPGNHSQAWRDNTQERKCADNSGRNAAAGRNRYAVSARNARNIAHVVNHNSLKLTPPHPNHIVAELVRDSDQLTMANYDYTSSHDNGYRRRGLSRSPTALRGADRLVLTRLGRPRGSSARAYQPVSPGGRLGA